jgi:hypothetical protein
LKHDSEGKIYLTCGLDILAMLIILLVKMLIQDHSQLTTGSLVFWMETIMLVLFGIAWLVKGKAAITEFVLNKL